MNRRTFLISGLMASSAAHCLAIQNQETNQPALPDKKSSSEVARKRPRQDLDLVFQFVVAGHGNLARVKELVAQEPKLVLAAWDWGGGDWETALGGASHTGNREIAKYLLSEGARI